MINMLDRRLLFGRYTLRLLLFLAFSSGLFIFKSTAFSQEKRDDPEFLSGAFGAFDFNRAKDQGTEFRVEYRSDKKLSNLFKPFAAAAYSTSGHYFLGGGLLVDLFFGRRYVVTPSLGPHFYFGGDSDLDLDFPIQFRSQLEVAYRLDNRARVGLSLSHYSNASMGSSNPGTESLMLYYSLPLNLQANR